jgi:hypothetical protein
MKNWGRRNILSIVVAVSLLVPVTSARSEVKADFLYNLSDFNGTIPYSWAQVYPDDYFNEVYVIIGNKVDVFNRNGMQIYDFVADSGNIFGMAVDAGGDILMLVNPDRRLGVVRCNYRGEPRTTIRFSGIPPEFSSDSYTQMIYRNGLIYLLNGTEMKVMVADMDGVFVKGYDIDTPLSAILSEKEMGDAAFGGFDVDSEGNMLFTCPILGRGFRLTVDGALVPIGKRGSGPGKYGIPGAIAADRMGNTFVCDRLRHVVLIFDKTDRFVTEFGYRGFNPGNLVVPVAIAISGDGMVYVSQLMNRGVNVYKLKYD